MDDQGAKGQEAQGQAQIVRDKRDTHGLVGKTLDGRLIVEGVIGAGGMGVVYLGHQTNVDRKVAIKVLISERADENTIRRFKNEAKAASRLTHPNTITIHDFGNWGDLLYIVMEFLEGQALQDVVDLKQPVDPIRTCHIISQVLASLHEAHNHGIIHRDIKPDNIFLKRVGAEHDFVKVLDFGVAKLGEQVGGSATLTQAGMIFGTPKYMSPEQAMAKKLSPASDVYSVGVVLYECLTGIAPFAASDPVSLLIQHVHDPAPAFAEMNPNVSIWPELEAITLRALAKKPEDRYSTAEEIRFAIDDVMMRMKAAAGTLSSGQMPLQQHNSGTGPSPTAPAAPIATPQPSGTWAAELGISEFEGHQVAEPSAAVQPGSPPTGGTTIVVQGGGTQRTLVLVIVLVGFLLLGAVGFLIYRQMQSQQGEGDVQEVTETDAETPQNDMTVVEADTNVIETDAAVVEADAGVVEADVAVVEADVAVTDAAAEVVVDTGQVTEQADAVTQDETLVAVADVEPPPEEVLEEVVDERNLVRVRFDRDPSDANIRIRGRDYERDGRYYVFDLADGERFRVSASAPHRLDRRVSVDLSDANDEGILNVRVRLEIDPCDPANGPVDPYVCD